ncbi:MAG: HIG1 domain-containing protein [Pseudomonadota bacterium]
MGYFIVLLVILTVIAVVGSLFLGIAVMLRGGELNKKYGNKLMIARVGFQGMSLVLLAILWMMSN